MSCKFSCIDFSFPLLSHRDVFRLISMMGIEAVDIGLLQDRSHIQPSQVIMDPFEEGKKLRKILKNEGLIAAGIFLQSALDFSSFQMIFCHLHKKADLLTNTLFERFLYPHDFVNYGAIMLYLFILASCSNGLNKPFQV